MFRQLFEEQDDFQLKILLFPNLNVLIDTPVHTYQQRPREHAAHSNRDRCVSLVCVVVTINHHKQ